MVLVPGPGQGQRVVQELSVGARVVIEGPGMLTVLGAAALLTVVLAIPRFGVYLSMVALTFGASAYGEIIRRVSRGTKDTDDPRWLASLVPNSIIKVLLCMLLAAGTVVPLWIWKAGYRQSPHFDRLAWIIAGVTWGILPLLMLSIYGTKPKGPSGFQRFLRSFVRHPFAILVSLAMVPLTLVVVEMGLLTVFSIPGHLRFFVLDYLPPPIEPERQALFLRFPLYDPGDFHDLPADLFRDAYRDGLLRGFSFVGSIPPSLSLPNRARVNAGTLLGIHEAAYSFVRLLITLTIVTSLLAAFAIQARWLGSIPNLGRRQTA